MSFHYENSIYLGPLLAESLSFLGFGNRSNASVVLLGSFFRCITWIYQRYPETAKAWLFVSGLSLSLAYLFHNTSEPNTFDASTQGRQDPNPLRPLILPSRTTHTRLFPKKHSFSYSYLLVGIPVQWRGLVAGMIGVNGSTAGTVEGSKAWFSVHAEDYLSRGDSQQGLDGKLRLYLETQVRNLRLPATSSLTTLNRVNQSVTTRIRIL